MPFLRTTIIISDLTRGQCLTVPKRIRTDVESLIREHNLPPSVIEHWSELPFLSRLVIIVDTESNASMIYSFLETKHPELKVHLSESFVRKHKSFDSTLTTPASPKQELYEEREPTKSDDEDSALPFVNVKARGLTPPKVLLGSLRLDTSVLKSNGTVSPMSPSITLDQV